MIKNIDLKEGKNRKYNSYFISNCYLYMSNIDNNPIHITSPDRCVFWLNDITVLYKDNAYLKFIPTSEMTRVEQLNSMTLFCIYLIILLLMFDTTNEWLFLPISGLILIIILYNVYEADDEGKRQELITKNKTVKNEITVPDINYRTFQVDDDGKIVTIDIDEDEQKRADAHSNNRNNYELEVGYYDSNGKLSYGTDHGIHKEEPRQSTYSLDEIRLYQKNKCRLPTVDNPFMNPSVDDFNKEDVPVACNSDDDDIHKNIDLKFNQDLYRDVEDVFNKKNSQRQFFTVAHNIPNDQEAFAKWLYKFPPTCKEDQTRCLRYQDLRTKY